jgi:uncharacterized protein
MADTDTVVHDRDGSRFVLMRGDRQIGETGYRTLEDGALDFIHTEVDPDLQERGLGSKLVGDALDQVRTSTDVRVVATCPFVKRFVAENDAYQDLLSR